jgi:hypothetical protein
MTQIFQADAIDPRGELANPAPVHKAGNIDQNIGHDFETGK